MALRTARATHVTPTGHHPAAVSSQLYAVLSNLLVTATEAVGSLGRKSGKGSSMSLLRLSTTYKKTGELLKAGPADLQSHTAAFLLPRDFYLVTTAAHLTCPSAFPPHLST